MEVAFWETFDFAAGGIETGITGLENKRETD
jgi:hypothetical protein